MLRLETDLRRYQTFVVNAGKVNKRKEKPLKIKDIPGNKKFFWNNAGVIPCVAGNLKLPVSKQN